MLEHPSPGLPDRLWRQRRLSLAHLGDQPPLAGPSPGAETDRKRQVAGHQSRSGPGQRAQGPGGRTAQDPLQDRHLPAGQLPRRPDLRGDRPRRRPDPAGIQWHHQPRGGPEPGRTRQRDPQLPCQGLPRAEPHQARVHGLRAVPHRRRVPPQQPGDGQGPARGRQGGPRLRPLLHLQDPAGEPAGHGPARPAGAQARARAPADRAGGERGEHLQPLLHRRHEPRGPLAGGP